MAGRKSVKLDRFVHLADTGKVQELFKDIKLFNMTSVQSEDKHVASDEEDETACSETEAEDPESVAMQCSYCQARFQSVEEQRLHYKLDWHRYNLKQSLSGRPSVTEERFEKVLDELENDEDNEISGSGEDSDEAEKESDTEDAMPGNPRLIFVTGPGKLVALHKALLLDSRRSRSEAGSEELAARVRSLPATTRWAVLMLGGGHFAGAVFHGREAVLHKTFHAYTVRAKQGGSQSSADQRGGHHKSAGASLRRYNEMALLQHIQAIVEQWAEHLAACHLIFYRAASSNKTSLFKIINKDDERLRTIPFQTRRATFNEVKRVHETLMRVEILGDVEDAEKIFSAHEKKSVKSLRRTQIHRSKSREDPFRPLPRIVQDLAGEAGGRESEDCETFNLITQEQTLTTDHLVEFESSPARRKGKRSKNNKGAGLQRDLEELEIESPVEEEKDTEVDESVKRQNELLTAVQSGNTKLLETLLGSLKPQQATELVNTQFGSGRTTVLHLAASQSSRTVVRALMLAGSDPAIRDASKKVPYNLAPDKETRIVFRRFMGEFPDRYDYKSAQVPAPLTKEAEEEKTTKVNEKKKAQRQAKREKEKIVKLEESKLKKEKEEKERFLNLSDREKRALAAERRVLNTNSGQVKLLIFIIAAI